MSLEQEVANLVEATTELLDAVNVRKSVLDGTVDDVEAIREDLQTNWGDKLAEAAEQAAIATTQADIATTKANEAFSSETAAANSASDAEESAEEAGLSATAAQTAKAEAETARTQANSAATNAAGSAEEAQISASDAAGSAIVASTQAGIATTQAGLSKDHADDSEASAGLAAISEANALDHRNRAQEWAEKAVDSPVESGQYSAKHHAQKSSDSATSSSLSAATATSKANEANTSALNAKDSEDAAKDSETKAKTSETNAASSSLASQQAKTASEQARDMSERWAEEDVDVEVKPLQFSAKHYAEKSKQSALSAASSESTASTHAQQAASSASDAADSASDSSDNAAIAVDAKNRSNDSAILAQDWATKLGGTVDGTEYSAKHYAHQARDQAEAISVGASETAKGIARFATQAEVTSGTGSDTIVSPSKLKVELDKKSNTNHVHNIATDTVAGFMSGADRIKLDGIQTGAQVNTITSVSGKVGDVVLSKSDVGLSNVNNTSDANKPVSTATQTALNLKIDKSAIGVANGVAPLDAESKIPSTYLPSYVDDVVEATSFQNLPANGEAGKIYTTTDNNKIYRWSGSSYIEISASPGSTDAVPEGQVNLYFTTARAASAAPVKSVSGRTGAITLTKTDVGLSNVDNTSDLNKPISTATQTALNGKANTSHTHAIGNVTGLQTALDGKASSVHEHPVSDITGLQTILDDTLRSDDIGVVVQGYNANTVTDANYVHTDNNYTTAEKNKLAGIAAGAQVNTVNSVAGKTGAVTLVKADVGLSNVNNTSDLNKPISTATQTALDGKANSKHIHDIADTVGLQDALDGKLGVNSNAVSASRLLTARTIGGVSFDGSANINLPGVNTTGNQNTTGSAAKLTTARTLTIGISSKSFNGSANVSWTLDEIGAASLSHTHTKAVIGLGNVDNTSDLDKPISTATQAALDTINTSIGTKANSAVQVVAGNGLTGGGTLASNRTLTLGTPNEVSTSSTSSVSASSHTHALSAGVKASLAKADSAVQPDMLGTAATFDSGFSGGLVATSARTAERVFYSGTSSEPTVTYSFGESTGGWARGIMTANLAGDTQRYGGFWFGLLGSGSNYTRGVLGFGNDSNWWQTNHQISLYQNQDPTVGTTNTIFHMGNILKSTGQDENFPMTQKAVTDALDGKLDSTANAASATKLATARSINGTSFNGTANITTTRWGAERTLTIGSTGKTVNGSANVAWSLSEIGAAPVGHTHPNATTSVAGFMSAADKAKLDSLSEQAPTIELPAYLELFSDTVQAGNVLVYCKHTTTEYSPTTGTFVPAKPTVIPLGFNVPLLSRVSGTIKFKVEYSWNPEDPKYGEDFYSIVKNGTIIFTVKMISGIQEIVFNVSPGDVLMNLGYATATTHALTYVITAPGLYCDRAYRGVFE